MSEMIKDELVLIKGDSIKYFSKNDNSSEIYRFRISKKAILGRDTIIARKGEFLFQVVQAQDVSDFYYLLSYDYNSFSIMKCSNGQVISYKRRR